ncbi:hypothetical protein [uncultured Slackia sp.]|uniref:hypothetical protein n=1 Tax=uncultured Slackia sp. TaxID=665903 RepID=UPI002676BC6A|nr:hypothetical protein [uncultured Slackia sp.]
MKKMCRATCPLALVAALSLALFPGAAWAQDASAAPVGSLVGAEQAGDEAALIVAEANGAQAEGKELQEVQPSFDQVLCELGSTSAEYTGVAITPRVVVRDGERLLVEGLDYAVSYENNVVPGEASVLIEGLGDYAGFEARVPFAIVKSEGNRIALPGSWQHNGTGWWYAYDDGGYPTNCALVVDGALYSFDSAGYMHTGWYIVDGAWRYSSSNGVVASGWAFVGGSWYYLDPQTGDMRTGWVNDGGTWYFTNSSGAMQTGWLCRFGTWYWLNGSGAMAHGWAWIDGSWYLFAEGGKMLTGWQKADGEWFLLNDSGAMRTGWVLQGETWYYLAGSGVMATGREEIGGSWYAFDDSGAMKTGWVLCDDGWVYARPSGALQTGWLAKDGWYWLDPEQQGLMVVGIQQIGGAWYKFQDSGRMESSCWFEFEDGKAAHASASGAVDYYAKYDENGDVVLKKESGDSFAGWELLGSSWFHFDENGAYDTGWEYINGAWYYFGSDGAMLTGWFKDAGKWYYLASSGAMLTGWHTIDSHYYQFGGDGAMREAEPLATTDIQRQLVAACGVVPTPGPGLCSEWVALVFNRIGQGQLLPNNDYDADDMFYAYCSLDDLSELRVGMIIAVPSHTHTYAGSIWGHICIYVGNNTIMDNIGRIRTMPLDEWLSYYTTTYSPKWGWYNGVPLE